MQYLADETSGSTTTNGRPQNSRPTVLCVDDDLEIGTIWRLRLSRLGVEVVCASNGSDGFATAVEKRPDLILLDLCMPDEDGNQVLARLRRHPETREIPVLMLTGSYAAAPRGQTLGYRADEYVAKPINFSELLPKLQAYLGPRR
jgi:DNA-binding response OmpR family regulator